MEQLILLRVKLIRAVDDLLGRMDTTRLFGWSVGLFLMAISLIPKFSHSLPGDSSVYVYLAGRMLDGEKYFTDFFEYNTPFAIGIYALPMMVGRGLGISDALSAKLFVLVLIIASVILVHWVVSKSREWSNITRYNALIIALLFTLNFRNDFPSNEMTTKSVAFICFILPYMFSLQLRLEKVVLSPRMEWMVGILQGVAIWFKPQYVLFPLVMEMYLAWRLRSFAVLFRKSNVIAASVIVLGYGTLLPVFFPGYLKCIPYFFVYYSADARGWIVWIDNITTALLYCLPLFVWLVALRRPLLGLASMSVLLVAILAEALVLNSELLLSFDQKSLLAFFVGLAFLYSLLVFMRAPRALKAEVGIIRKTFAVVAVMFASVCIYNIINAVSAFIPHTSYKETVVNEMVDYTQRYAPHEPIVTLSDNTEHFVLTMLALDKRPYPVFHSLRMLVDLADRKTVFVQKEPDKDWQKGYDYFYGATLQFFEKTPPKLVFVSRMTTSRELTHCMPLPLDIMLSQNHAFAKIWEGHYQQIGSIIATQLPQWLEEEPTNKATISMGGKAHEISFPPAKPLKTWLDVYIRKD